MGSVEERETFQKDFEVCSEAEDGVGDYADSPPQGALRTQHGWGSQTT